MANEVLPTSHRKPLLLRELTSQIASTSLLPEFRKLRNHISVIASLPNIHLSSSLLQRTGQLSYIALETESFLELGILQGNKVLVHESTSGLCRIATAVPLEPSESVSHASNSTMNSCVISPILAHNLGLQLHLLPFLNPSAANLNTSEALKMSELAVQLDIYVSHSFDETVIPCATHVKLAVVKVPEAPVLSPAQIHSENRQLEIDSSLKKHFENGQVITVGDLLALPIQQEKGSFYGCHNTLQIMAPIMFKVVGAEPETEAFLFVRPDRTALVLTGSVPSPIPPNISQHFLPLDWPRHPKPAQTVQLASMLAPMLHHDSSSLMLRTALLLKGPPCVGKRALARSICEDLGLNCVEYSCQDLVGGSEKATSEALEEAFNMAASYAPSVLYLRRFQAITRGSSNASPEADSGRMSASSAIATTLHHCIGSFTSGVRKFAANRELSRQERVAPDSACSKKLPEVIAGLLQGQKVLVTSSGHCGRPVILMAAVEDSDSLPVAFRRCFTHEIDVDPPDEDQRLQILRYHLGRELISKQNEDDLDASIASIASQTSGLMARDMAAIAADALNSAAQRQSDEALLTVADLESAMEGAKKRTASAIGTPKVPNVKWDDVGGLEDVKRAILDTVQLPLQHRDLFAMGLKQRSGVLLYGPPGTGKTLLAKAVATECSLNFLSVKGPELINSYIGESEKNVRDVFQKARAATPCVIFFDELDALAPARGAMGDSGGVMDRVVSQLLAEIDGLSSNSQDLFVIGATNRPDLIDPALLRPGRFDKMLYVGISSHPSHRCRVLQALTRKFNLAQDVDLDMVSRICLETMTGADLYAVCADAWMNAAKRKVSQLESNGESQGTTVEVQQQDFVKAATELVPSLSAAELLRYEQLREQMEGNR